MALFCLKNKDSPKKEKERRLASILSVEEIE